MLSANFVLMPCISRVNFVKFPVTRCKIDGQSIRSTFGRAFGLNASLMSKTKELRSCPVISAALDGFLILVISAKTCKLTSLNARARICAFDVFDFSIPGLPAFSLAGVVDYLTGARTGVFEGRTLGRGEGTFLAAKVC
jgi:hypothetical protein